MDEKTMVNDILSCAKSSLSLYQMGIAETENLQLRQVLQQLRDDTLTIKTSSSTIKR